MAGQKKYLYLSADYGTSAMAVSYRILIFDANDQLTDITEPSAIRFKAGSGDTPQKVAWCPGTNAFIWGFEVESALRTRIIRHEDVIELWKLALYQDHQNTEHATRVLEQLKAYDAYNITADGSKLTVDYLITVHLRAVIEKVQNILRRGKGALINNVDDLEVRLFLSCPQMWKAPACRRMTLAAKAAGANFVQITSEPKCAAARLIHTLQRSDSLKLVEGEEPVIADPGGGTGDFLTCRVGRDASNGAKVTLEIVDTPYGALCGSQMINQEFLTWVKSTSPPCARTHTKMTYEQRRQRLNFSDIALLKEANQVFEVFKCDFTGTETYYVYIAGATPSMSIWDVTVTSQQMKKFFQPVIKQVFEAIDERLTKNTRTIFVVGGLAHSKYFRALLFQRYQDNDHPKFNRKYNVYDCDDSDNDIAYLVAHGAHVRYHITEVCGVAAKETLGIAQDEYYDEKMHGYECNWQPGDVDGRGRRIRTRRRNNHFRVPDEVDSGDSVNNTWRTIKGFNATYAPGQHHTTSKLQYRFVEVNENGEPFEESLKQQIYWSEQPYKDKTPIFIDYADILNMRPHGIKEYFSRMDLQPDLFEWGPPLSADFPNFANLGFEKKEIQSDEDGCDSCQELARKKKKPKKNCKDCQTTRYGPSKDGYEIYYQFVVFGSGANIKVQWQMILPNAYSKILNSSGMLPWDEANPPTFLAGETYDLLNELHIMEEEFSPIMRD